MSALWGASSICLGIAALLLASCSDMPKTTAHLAEPDTVTVAVPPSVTPDESTATPSASIQPTPSPVPPTTVAQTKARTERATAVAPARERSSTAQSRTPNQAATTAVQRAREDLAQRLGVAIDTIEVLSVQQRFKPNGVSDSPGKPNGWEIRLAASDQAYRYQVDSNGQLRRG